MKITNNKNEVEKFISLYFILLPISNILQLAIGVKARFVIPVFYIVLMFFYHKQINFKYITYIIFTLLLLLPYSLFVYKDYLYNWFGLMYMLIISALPWFFIGESIERYDEVLKEIERKSFWIFLSNCLLIVYAYKTGRSMLGNMEISYSILPLCIFSINSFLNKRSISFFIYAIFSSIIIVVVGSRGPLLCIMVFIIINLLLNIKKRPIMVAFIIMMIIIFAFNFNYIINSLIDTLANYNIRSRTLNKIASNDIANDTGRNVIHEVVLYHLKQKPILGLGLGGDRIYINNEVYNMSKDMSSCYTHNIIIEIIAQYGYFFGSLFLIFLMFILLNAFFRGDYIEKNFINILFSTEIVRLFLSSSYLISPIFFLLLGICVSITNKNGRKERNK